MSDRPLLILGTGRFAEEIADLVSETPGWRLDGFVQSLDREQVGGTIGDTRVLWVDDLGSFALTHHAIAALGSPRRQRFIEKVADHRMPFATVLHPLSRISSTSSVGEGSIVGVGCIVAAHTRVGRHVILNRAATIGHHTEVEDFVTIGPGVNVAGSCFIGRGTYLGIGATVLDHVSIGSGVMVGASALVTKDVPDGVTVVGVPARVVGEGSTATE